MPPKHSAACSTNSGGAFFPGGTRSPSALQWYVAVAERVSVVGRGRRTCRGENLANSLKQTSLFRNAQSAYQTAMKFPAFLLTLGAAFFLSGCASTEFTPWVGTSIQQGTGGTRKVVNGVDVWQYGTPPRRYQMLGLIEDTREEGNVFSDMLDDVTKKAREVGADAVILLDADRRQTGFTSSPSTTTVKVKKDTATATTFGGETSVTYEDKVRFQAVKYLSGS